MCPLALIRFHIVIHRLSLILYYRAPRSSVASSWPPRPYTAASSASRTPPHALPSLCLEYPTRRRWQRTRGQCHRRPVRHGPRSRDAHSFREKDDSEGQVGNHQVSLSLPHALNARSHSAPSRGYPRAPPLRAGRAVHKLPVLYTISLPMRGSVQGRDRLQGTPEGCNHSTDRR